MPSTFAWRDYRVSFMRETPKAEGMREHRS